MTPESLILSTSAALLALGASGVLLRRNPIAVLMSLELMLNAANLVLVLGARVHDRVDGQAAALLILVIAAAEAVIGLGLALALFRNRAVADADEAHEVRG